MTTVDQLIGDLLLRHNCVIIPSFGGFVAKPVSAQIDYRKGTMLPPGKSLLFNRQLINNDGLLINELSQANNISFDEASLEVSEKISSWNAALKNGGRIEIDRVGNLFFDEERNMCFEQDRFFNLLLESFGLGKVHFLTEEDVQIVEHKIETTRVYESPKPVVESPKVEKPVIDTPMKMATVVEEAPIIEIKGPRIKKEEKVLAFDGKSNDDQTNVIEHPAARKRRPWRYVAAVCILPIAFYSVWIPMKTDVLESGIISLNDFNPFYSSSDGRYKKEDLTKEITVVKSDENSLEDEIANLDSDKKHYPYKFDDDTYIQVNLPDTETIDIAENVEPTPQLSETQETFNASAINYIVGCFGNKANAENLVAKLKANGLEGRIYDKKNGLHRVTAGSALSLGSYHEIKSQADALGLSGWKLN
ncbi:MAG: HU-CCDC81 and SPOR domain-containing protein [Crocinitomicaceae bacterium]|nr:HU-CCDC81 and SPOR domain-containing protein [Crocinitomicaceae bacterium]